MNYEQRYKESLERARKIENGEPFDVPDGTSIPVAIFPELKESEDERIRKELTDYIKSKFENSCSPTPSKNILGNWIAWLEKQGEQKSVDKPNKANPTFHEGDWVVSKYSGSVHQIKSCAPINLKYGYSLTDGDYISSDVVNNYRLWTIQDAKDGDVISYDDGWTCIFKHIHGIWYSSYCFITADGEFHTGYEEHAVDSKINGNAHPATKEQRDLLFQKIKKARYTWNIDKKELIKL